MADVFCAFSVFSTKLKIDTYRFGIEEVESCIKIHSAKVYIYKKYAPAFAEGIFLWRRCRNEIRHRRMKSGKPDEVRYTDEVFACAKIVVVSRPLNIIIRKLTVIREVEVAVFVE